MAFLQITKSELGGPRRSRETTHPQMPPRGVSGHRRSKIDRPRGVFCLIPPPGDHPQAPPGEAAGRLSAGRPVETLGVQGGIWGRRFPQETRGGGDGDRPSGCRGLEGRCPRWGGARLRSAMPPEPPRGATLPTVLPVVVQPLVPHPAPPRPSGRTRPVEGGRDGRGRLLPEKSGAGRPKPVRPAPAPRPDRGPGRREGGRGAGLAAAAPVTHPRPDLALPPTPGARPLHPVPASPPTRRHQPERLSALEGRLMWPPVL